MAELERIGALFRKKREEKKLSLKECENLTSIRAGFLQAIEDGRIHEALASVYAIGFTKQYAQFLGIDLDQIAKEYPSMWANPKVYHDFSRGIGTLEVRRAFGGGIQWLPNLLWAIGIVSIIIVAYYTAKTVGAL